MTSSKRLFAKAPEGAAVLFFIDSLAPASSPFGLRLCRTAPAGSIQIFATLGFAAYSTSRG